MIGTYLAHGWMHFFMVQVDYKFGAWLMHLFMVHVDYRLMVDALVYGTG
jgi:hypothetical protein